MVKSELIKQSPLRILDASTNGGIGKGNVGVLAARHGVGKTSALVHIATDKLLQGKRVIHVSFANRTEHILEYYEEIFTEISKIKNLSGALAVRDEIASRRTVMNFDQKTSTTAHVVESVRARIKAGGFPADLVVIDEFDFNHAQADDLRQFRDFAKVEGLELWFSVSLDQEGESAANPIPQLLERHIAFIDVLVNLRHHKEDGKVHLELVKDHGHSPRDTHLVLDTKTLLISQE
jgi:KaiC/GvpD/RAD55 family RecA-like ATPase